MGSHILSFIRKNVSALPGWRTDRKLVVLESDDWGSIRMPSPEVYNKLIMSGLDLESDEGALFNKYDSLATSDDLSALFEVLDSVKDATGRPAVITPVSVVANPNFNKIRQGNFKNYFFETFTDTLARYPGCEDSFTLWKEGMGRRLFIPQFHGREHLNVSVWMKALSEGNVTSRLGFDHTFWGMTTRSEPGIGVEFQAAFDFIEPGDLKLQQEIISTGLDLFRDIFGYRASYFAPPNGPFSSRLEPLLAEKGIKYLSMPRIQTEPLGHGKTRLRFHWIGRKTESGLIILTRNCFFEPVVEGIDWVDRCLSDISIAFRWKKPAVISSHRVNYTGGISADNRTKGLMQLSQLLRKITKIWPDTEFITSEELGKTIVND